jgi:hypothetical protein
VRQNLALPDKFLYNYQNHRSKKMRINRIYGRFQLTQTRKLVFLLMLTISVVLVGLTLARTTNCLASLARTDSIVQQAAVDAEVDADDVEKYFAEDKLLADALKNKNMFAPTPQQQHPVKEVTGIFAGRVLIRDKWYKVGESVADAKIVAIVPTHATIEWQGSQKTFRPFDAKVAQAPTKSKAPKTVTNTGKSTVVKSDKASKAARKAEKKKGSPDWAKKMSIDELHDVRGKIADHIEGLRAKGVTDPAKYESAVKKMEAVDGAILEKQRSK